MGFRTNAYAKVWKIEKGNGNFYNAEMSVSHKNKETGNYETDWANKFVRLVGKAATQAESISSGDTVRIGDCDVTNKWDKEKKIMYTNYVIFSFNDTENNSAPAQKPGKAAPPAEDPFAALDQGGADDVGELPFS